MKLLKIAGTAATIAMAAASLQAAQDSSDWLNERMTLKSSGPRFAKQELSLDLFGSFNGGERGIENLFDTNLRHNGYWGGGAGLNYFFTRYLGASVDFNMSSKPSSLNLVDDVAGHLVLRAPIDSLSLAPYIFGGGGRGMSPVWQWMYDAGVGVDLRLNPKLGLFSDARYMWSDDSRDLDRLLIRAGLRIVF